MTTTAAAPHESTAMVDVDTFVDEDRPTSWSSQMVALINAGHYREGYEVLAQHMPYIENQLRPYAERLAGKENHWTRGFKWISTLLDAPVPSRILDVGCAVGSVAIELARHGHRTWGVDILPNMIDKGRELIDSLELTDRAHLVQGDIRAFPEQFEDGFFDAAVTRDVFEHLDDAALLEVLAGLKRVVRPGGKIVIETSPAKFYYWFEPDRRKLLSLLMPAVWMPDAWFTAYVRWLDRWYVRGIRNEPASFYRQEYAHINCMDHVHLQRLMEQAGLTDVQTFCTHAHPGFKDEGCRRRWWTRWLFGRKSIAGRNVFGVAMVPSASKEEE